ncbi:MAG: nicotinate-nucleotide adenylyltransferase [Candidatus Hepatoplasma scabrum]|nr:MAG: nicotinate-nucleotide adenylyltransferase [Candidatus Hepatoplasma sp.]
MKVGILGGTFNPFHKGHLNIIKNIKKEFGLKQIWIIPTYITVDKIFSIENISAKKRYKIIKYTLKKLKINWIKLSNIEIKNHNISYTYETLVKLKEKYPDNQFYFIMGEDRYHTFHNWYKYEEIQKLANIIVYRRFITGSYHNKFIDEKYIEFYDEIIYDISSTDILQNLRWEELLEPTKKYLAKNYLYLKTIVFNNLKFRRYQHSVSVASHAKRLAKNYHYFNWKKAYYAGLIHDLFKYHSKNFLLEYVSKNLKENEELPPFPALHGYAAAFWLEQMYKIKDQEFLGAIRKHTTAARKMSKLDKIIYVADKISSDRKGKEIYHQRKQAYKNLDFTFAKLLNKQVEKLKERGIKFTDLDKNTRDAYIRYVLKLKSSKKINKYYQNMEFNYENKWTGIKKINK